MKPLTQVIRSGTVLAAVLLVVACPPNALLSNVEQQVTLVKSGNQPVATPQMSPPSGTYPGNQNVTITDSTPGATIQYTIDGSKPTSSSPVNTAPIPVAGDGKHETIIAYANKAGMTDSALATANYVINFNQVQTPTFSLATGSHVAPGTTVTISCATGGATINYTTDGSTPTSSHGTAYTGPVAVNADETIQAMAYKPPMNDSNVASAAYTVWVYTHYLFVNNDGSSTVAGFKIAADGSLTSIGTPVASGIPMGSGIAISPNVGGTLNSFLYTSGNSTTPPNLGYVQAWSIGAGGVPATLGALLLSNGVGTGQLAITPDRSHLYGANELSGDGSAYTVAGNGTLTLLNNFTTAGGTDPVGVAITPNGSFMFVGDWGNSLLGEYSLGSTGATFINYIGATKPVGVAVSPNGSFLLVANQVSNTVSSYSIGTGGSLTLISNLPGGSIPWGVAVSPNISGYWAFPGFVDSAIRHSFTE